MREATRCSQDEPAQRNEEPRKRLEHAGFLPLGSVLVDKDQRTHTFVGTRENGRGLAFFFMPDLRAFQHMPRPWSCAFLDAALAKFPDITSHLRPHP